jgi:YqaJ-like viral recombinase domain
MTVEIVECEQGGDAWFKARLGLPTSSEFSTVMAKGKGGGESLTRKTYMMKLAGEIMTGQPCENYNNGFMERGKQMEAEARDLYDFMRPADCPEMVRVGFVRNGNKGCSPDALIGTDGGLEVKTAAPHLLIPILLRNEFPPEHKAQVQGNLWVTERAWWDLIVYYPKMPLFSIRVGRDEEYIVQMSTAVDQFNEELAAIVAKLRQREAA